MLRPTDLAGNFAQNRKNANGNLGILVDNLTLRPAAFSFAKRWSLRHSINSDFDFETRIFDLLRAGLLFLSFRDATAGGERAAERQQVRRLT
jgi:hypothetical protein